MTVFPPTIKKYKITESTPSRDLLTLGRFYSEAGGYASTILDRPHQSFARKCRQRYDKVIDTLIDREVIFKPNDIWATPTTKFDLSDLQSMTIDQLEAQYLLCSSSHDKRCRAGREGFTYFQEGYIVKELSRRRATNRSEKIRIEYCRSIYRNELENLAFIIQKPEGNSSAITIFEHDSAYTSDQLIALIRLYGRFRTVAEREILVQCVDKALDLIETSGQDVELITLISELTEPYCRRNVQIPESVYEVMLKVIKRWTRKHHLNDPDIIIPMLAYSIHTSEWEWRRKAQRIINRCYRRIINTEFVSSSFIEAIDNLYIAEMCYEFVSHYKLVKMATAWKDVVSIVNETDEIVSATHIYKLLKVAERVRDYVATSQELELGLRHKLNVLAGNNNIEALAYVELIKQQESGSKLSDERLIQSNTLI